MRPLDRNEEIVEPMRERRAKYEGDDDVIMDILKEGTKRALVATEETLEMVRQAASLKSFGR